MEMAEAGCPRTKHSPVVPTHRVFDSGVDMA